MTTDDLKALVRDVPNFPTEWIVFKEIMPLVGNACLRTIDSRSPTRPASRCHSLGGIVSDSPVAVV